MIRTWVWSRILCRWELKFLTPAAWGQLPHVVAGSLALLCVGTAPAWTPPPPIPPIAYVPLHGAPPFISYPPPWSPLSGGYVPPTAWVPPVGFVPFGNGGRVGDVADIPGRNDNRPDRRNDRDIRSIAEGDTPAAVVTPPDQRVPEPGSLALLAGAVVAMLWGRR